MKDPITKTRLLEELALLEVALQTPVIPGETEQWTDAVDQALQRAAPLYRRAIEHEHEQKMRDVLHEDPEMARRIETIRREDALGREMLDSLQTKIRHLAEAVPKAGWDEARLQSRLDDLMNAGIEFVLHARKQEIALDTWMAESVQRDRGVAD